MRRALFFLLNLFSTQVLAQRPVLELDHLYIVVQPPTSRAADALRQVGIVVDTAITHHAGQGTASMAAFFENAYLELLWVDSATAVDSAHLSDLADFRRAASWRDSGASPFGVGLHFVGSAAELPVPTRRDPAPHLGANMFYLLLRQPEEAQAADMFVMPAPAAAPQWLERFRARRPNLFTHPLGAHRITRVLLHGSPANRPRAIDLNIASLGFEPAPTQYVIVELDGAPQGREWDLRPGLPLVLRGAHTIAGDWDAYVASGSTALAGFEGWRRMAFAHFAGREDNVWGRQSREFGANPTEGIQPAFPDRQFYRFVKKIDMRLDRIRSSSRHSRPEILGSPKREHFGRESGNDPMTQIWSDAS